MNEQANETNRGRVRRLLIEPLAQDGFRFPKAVADDAARDQLNRIADALAYLPEGVLEALRESLATKGEGAARRFWPAQATIVGLAEAFHPRPIEDLPNVARWFGSAAGRAAIEGNRLVAEFEFWQRRKAPPVTDQHRRLVAERAADYARRVELIEDRLRRGAPLIHDEAGWFRWYEATLARAQALVAAP